MCFKVAGKIAAELAKIGDALADTHARSRSTRRSARPDLSKGRERRSLGPLYLRKLPNAGGADGGLPCANCGPMHRSKTATLFDHLVRSSLSGTVRPRALAVLRLITKSNLVGRTTGKSSGLAPLRIRPA